MLPGNINALLVVESQKGGEKKSDPRTQLTIVLLHQGKGTI